MDENRRGLVLAGFVLSALIVVAVKVQAQSKWKGTIVRQGDLTVVANPGEPLYGTPVLELAEELSIGGADAQGENALEQVRQVLVDETGSIYVLEPRAARIKVFDAGGKYLRTIGRKGQGPGELEYPMGMSLNEKTGELAIQTLTGGISFFKPDGTYLRRLTLGGRMTGRARFDSGGRIYVLDIVLDEKDSKYATKKLAPDGSLLATISETPTPNGPGNVSRAFIPVAYFEVDREDRLIYGFPETYEILIYDPDRTKIIRKITRIYDHVAVTEKDMAEHKKDLPPGFPFELRFPKHHPAFSRFFLSDLGHIFVQTHEKADGAKLMHDIFDPDGRFIGRIPLRSSAVEIRKGKYYALEEDEDGFQCVKRYAVSWKVR